MTVTGILKNKTLQQQLSGSGYAVVPFADGVMLEELKSFYKSLGPAPARGTQVTMFNPSYEYRRSVDNKIKEVCGDKAEELIDGYQVLYTNFLVKEPGMEGDFPVHQDWTYVDEPEFSSYAIWAPLADVDENNGALHVLEGSHRFHHALRGPHVHEPFSSISEAIRNKYSIPIRLHAGEALIWDHRLIHFSKPNLTDTARMAFTLIMVPEGVPVIHCYGTPESAGTTIEKYKVDTAFYMKYTIGSRPVAVPLIETVEQPAVNFDEKTIEQMIQEPGK